MLLRLVLHECIDRSLRDLQLVADVPRACRPLAFKARQHFVNPIGPKRKRGDISVPCGRRALPMNQTVRGTRWGQIAMGRGADLLDKAPLAQGTCENNNILGPHVGHCRDFDSVVATASGNADSTRSWSCRSRGDGSSLSAMTYVGQFGSADRMSHARRGQRPVGGHVDASRQATLAILLLVEAGRAVPADVLPQGPAGAGRSSAFVRACGPRLRLICPPASAVA